MKVFVAIIAAVRILHPGTSLVCAEQPPVEEVQILIQVNNESPYQLVVDGHATPPPDGGSTEETVGRFASAQIVRHALQSRQYGLNLHAFALLPGRSGKDGPSTGCEASITPTTVAALQALMTVYKTKGQEIGCVISFAME
jgi:hypothetical protein